MAQLKIVGKVEADKQDQLITIRVAQYNGKTNVAVDVYDPYNTARVGNFITALKTHKEHKGTYIQLSEINKRLVPEQIPTTDQT